MPTQDPSLFGLTPELYQQQQDARAAEQATNFAQLDPSQRGAYGMFMAGRGVGNAFGAPDPMHNMLRVRQSVMQEIDPSDPASFRAAAQKLLQAKDYQGAEHLVKTSRELEVSMATALEKRSQSVKALREGDTSEVRNAIAMTDAAGLQRGTPAYQAAFKTNLEQLTAGKEGLKVVGVAADTREPVYTDGKLQYTFKAGPDGQQVKVPYNGGVDRSTANVKVNAKGGDVIEEDAYHKKAGANYADLEKETMEKARGSAMALRTLGNMEKAVKGGVYNGPQANMTTDAANFLASIGLLSPKEKETLTNSQEYQKYAKDLVMQDLGGKMGSGVSNADRDYIEARIPQITTSPQARAELIAKLKELHTKNITQYRKMQSHLKTNGTLKGFDFANADGMADAPAEEGTAANPIKLTPRK